MIIKGTKQLGSFKKGISIYIPKKRTGSGAPSGIPVASTEKVNVTLPSVTYFPALSPQLVGYYSTIAIRGYFSDGEYAEESWSVGGNTNYLNTFYVSYLSRTITVELIAPNNYSAIANHGELADGLKPYWRLIYWEGNCSDGYCSQSPSQLFNCVNGTNPNLIPTTGWPTGITITAAIPVSTTSLLINGGVTGPTNTFTKATGNTDIYPCYYQQGSSNPTTKYTFNHLWRSSTYNGGDQWTQARLGVATRKLVGGSGNSFILGSNCSSETTVSVSPTWVLFYESSDEYGPFMSTYATNPSQDFNNIPTTGWVMHGDLSSVTITAAPSSFPDTATTNVVNALINTSDADTTSYLQSVGFTASGGMFSIPLTKQVPPSQFYYSVEYRTTFSDGAPCKLVHSTGANNRWFFVMEKFAGTHEEYGDEYSILININTPATGQSNATIPAVRSSYSGTNINSMVSPNCFS